MSTYYKENNSTVVYRIAAAKITYEKADGSIVTLPLNPSSVAALGAPSGTAATDIATLYAKVNELLVALKS